MAGAYACPEIPPERVSPCVMLLAETGLKSLVLVLGEERMGLAFAPGMTPKSLL